MNVKIIVKHSPDTHAEGRQVNTCERDSEGSAAKTNGIYTQLWGSVKKPGAEIVLGGIVGSQAYGLNHEDSDIDRIAVFATKSTNLFKLTQPAETVTFHEPNDIVFHELRKYVSLALKANPTITELMWLPKHEMVTQTGLELKDFKEKFLTERHVKSAYLGYARSQFARLTRRESHTENRTRKHALHMARLLNQGFELYTTGQLTVRLENPQWYAAFSEKGSRYWGEWFREAEQKFEDAKSVLTNTDHSQEIEQWLIRTRVQQMKSN